MKVRNLGERPSYEINWAIRYCVQDLTPFLRTMGISRSSLVIGKGGDSRVTLPGLFGVELDSWFCSSNVWVLSPLEASSFLSAHIALNL